MSLKLVNVLSLVAGLALLGGCIDSTDDDNQAGSTPQTVASLSNPMTASETKAFTAAINNYRATGASCGSRGVFGTQDLLTLNNTLTDAAQAHSNDQFEMSEMSHTGSDGSNPGERITRQGYKWSSVRENVASGFFNSVEHLAEAWMNSDGHCANMMASNVSEFGIAVTRLDTGGGYWTLKLAHSK